MILQLCAPARKTIVSEKISLAIFLDCVFVGLGGLVGSVLRYLVSLMPLRHGSGFPLLTLGINVLGAFVLGLIVGFAGRSTSLDPRTLLFLKVGLCGGFTTFSTFALEAQGLLAGGKPGVALLYMLLSVVLCVGAVFTAGAIVR
jgi:CrcB protein